MKLDFLKEPDGKIMIDFLSTPLKRIKNNCLKSFEYP